MKGFGLIDEVISEPKSWEVSPEDLSDSKKEAAFDAIANNLKNSLSKHLTALNRDDPQKRITARFKKFREMGEWV